MNIVEKYGIESAPDCEGHVVVIDVLRAFTTAAFAFSSGVDEIFLVSSADEAFEIKKRNPGVILVGENRGRKIEGFDFGNSPEAMSKIDLSGKRIVLRSSSGTQGVVQAKGAEQILLGSLVVASSTVKFLNLATPNVVSLLAMGSPKGPDKEEDLACRTYMKHLLEKEPIDQQKIIDEVTNSPAGRMALDPEVHWKTAGDLECAVSIDKFRFAMPVFREGQFLIARKVGV
jgi:2-phosphosulfolactate phosphatase